MRCHIILWRELGSSTDFFCFIIDQSDDYDVKRIVKKKSSSNFPEPKSDTFKLFLLSNQPSKTQRCPAVLLEKWLKQSINYQNSWQFIFFRSFNGQTVAALKGTQISLHCPNIRGQDLGWNTAKWFIQWNVWWQWNVCIHMANKPQDTHIWLTYFV